MPRNKTNTRFSRTENKREFSRKCCFIVLIIILLSGILAVALGLTIPAIIAKENKKKMEQYERRINKSLSRYLDNMDDTIDPCEDFYHYACGKFINKWPKGTLNEDVNKVIHREILKNTEEMLRSGNHVKDNNDYRNKVRSFYHSCMDEALLNSLDKTPLTNLLEQFGGWPISKGNLWQSRTADWMDLTLLMHQKQLVSDYLMELSVIPDVFDESSYILMVSQPSKLSLPLAAYNQNALMSVYKQYVTNVAKFLGAPQNTVDQDVNELIRFEAELANMTQSITSEHYVKLSVNQLKIEIPEIDWYDYFNNLLPYHVKSNVQILIRGKEYLQKFASFIWNKDLRVVTNYLLWRIVSPSGMRYLYKDAVAIQEDFYRNTQGETPETTRSDMCTDDTTYFLYLAVNAMYVKKYIPQSLKPTVINFVDLIHQEFINAIDEIKWMDEPSKITARKKMAKMKSYIAFPDEIHDENAVNDYYKELTIRNDTLLQNVLRIKRFEKLQNFLLLNERERLEWTHHGPVLAASASYSIKNELTITLPFLQGIYYDPKGLWVTNFGALGSVIGHELFHSIDKKASSYDDKGISHQWWTNYTRESFENREKCFISKYNNFTISSLNISVNSVKTVAENFADNAGLNIALQAFLSWVKTNGEEVIPKSIRATAKQLFWISYANKYCSVQSPQMIYRQIYLEDHSPDKYRVIGAVSNMHQFANDFNCGKQSMMNTYLKCSVT